MASLSRRELAIQRVRQNAAFRERMDSWAAHDPIETIKQDCAIRAWRDKRQPLDAAAVCISSALDRNGIGPEAHELPARAVNPRSAVRGIGY